MIKIIILFVIIVNLLDTIVYYTKHITDMFSMQSNFGIKNIPNILSFFIEIIIVIETIL